MRALIKLSILIPAMNNKENSPLPYSMLNPDTSSDSPSARSNGARFVSAKAVVNHILKIGKINNKNQKFPCTFLIDRKSNSHLSKITAIIHSAILTSYEIVCATARIAPSKAYFELEAHPESKMQYTFNLETAKKNSIPNLNGLA